MDMTTVVPREAILEAMFTTFTAFVLSRPVVGRRLKQPEVFGGGGGSVVSTVRWFERLCAPGGQKDTSESRAHFVTCGRFIQEQYRGPCEQLYSNRNASLLAARDATLHVVADGRVDDRAKPELLRDVMRAVELGMQRHLAPHT